MNDNALYLEVDEDITSAIDKLGKTSGGPVQIVVPKRSTILQSIINLKLLKKAADQSGKELVLVTSDRIATDLASRIGLAVAPAIGAKPVLSTASMPANLHSTEEIIDADDPEPPPAPPDVKSPQANAPVVKRVPIRDEPALVGGEQGPASSTINAPKAPSVPNFSKLRRRVMWVSLAVLLIGGYFAAMYEFTSAKVIMYVSGSRVNIDTMFTVDPSLKVTDRSKSILAGQIVSVSKDLSGPFVPTGKKDAGTKATGIITAYNEYDTNPHALVSGTRFQAPDGKLFRTKADGSVPGATVGLSGGQVVLNPGKSDPIPVEADVAGDSYNEAPAKYSIPGYSAAMQAKIYGQGAQMSGGTTKTVTITSQADVDTEKVALIAKDKDASARDLNSKIPGGYIAIASSQSQVVDSLAPDPAVGAEGDTGTLSMKVTYTELVVKKTEYEALLHAQEQKQIGDNNQIYDDGLSGAQISLTGDKDASGRMAFHLTTEAYSGSKLDKQIIASKLKGLRFGDATQAASGLPGVTRADISISPGWVSKMPTRTDKIVITIQVAAGK